MYRSEATRRHMRDICILALCFPTHSPRCSWNPANGHKNHSLFGDRNLLQFFLTRKSIYIGRSCCNVAHFWLVNKFWIRTQKAAIASS